MRPLENIASLDNLKVLHKSPAFICGHPKSGTSLIRAILDSHPELIVYPEETSFFRRYLPKALGLSLDEQLELAGRYLIHIFTWNRENPPPSQEGFPDRDYSHISFMAVSQALHQMIKEYGCTHAGDILAAAILAYGKVTHQLQPVARRWVEKSPYNEYYAAQIFAWWPHARCIHVVRDPRDNYVSYHRKHSSWSPEFFASNWRCSTEAGLENVRCYGSNRYILIRFEDIAQNPQAGLKEICDFLEINEHPSMEQPTRAGQVWQGNSMYAEKFTAISATPVGRWVDDLKPQEAGVIEILSRQVMQVLGYHSSQSQRLTARWLASIWPVRRRIQGLRNRMGKFQSEVDVD